MLPTRTNPLRPLAFALAAVALIASLPGCGTSSEPEEIWCETGTGRGEVVYPRAICYAPVDDSFFIIDRVAHVQHLDRRGKWLADWQMPAKQFGKPVGVAVGPDGNVWVPDTHYHRVIVYSPQGQMIRMFGEEGRGDGQFIYPTDVKFDEQQHVFVSEYGDNDRVQVFAIEGGLANIARGAIRKLYQFGRFGDGDGQFSRPQAMVIEHGLVYITDACNHRIAVFKTDGSFVRNMGRVGAGLGEFRFPYGLDEDREGHLIVCEFGNNRVQMIDKETGTGLKIWGTGGREPGQFAYP